MKVPQSKCAACHKGTGSGAGALAQHSSTVTKGRACSVCHTQKLHAKALGSAIVSCQACHSGKFHAVQRLPGKAACTRCHTAARSHSDGFACVLCHKTAVHALRPTAAFRL